MSNPIFKSITLTWWQTGIFKLVLVSLGIIIGASFASYLIPLFWLFWLIVFAGGVYIFIAWVKQ